MFQTVRKFQTSTRGSGGGGGGMGGGSMRGGGKSSSKKSFRQLNNTTSIESASNSTTSAADKSGLHKNNNNNDSDKPQNDAEQLSRWQKTKAHMKREMWSYVGLLGVFCMYFGVLMCVFALKGVLALPMVMTICGVILTSLGGSNLFLSWMCYRYQRKKHRRFNGCCCFFGEGDDAPVSASDDLPRVKTRPRGHSLAGFLTPEFAKYAEFVARDRRYDNKRYHVLREYNPAHISISFAHKYWLEQQKPLLQSGVGSPALLPASDPASLRKQESGGGNSDVFPSSVSSSYRKLESRAENSGSGSFPSSVPTSPRKLKSKPGTSDFFPASVPTSPRRPRKPQTNDPKRKLVKTNSLQRHRQLSS